MKTKLEAIRERNKAAQKQAEQGRAFTFPEADRAFLLKMLPWVGHTDNCISGIQNRNVGCTCGLTALLETPE